MKKLSWLTAVLLLFTLSLTGCSLSNLVSGEKTSSKQSQNADDKDVKDDKKDVDVQASAASGKDQQQVSSDQEQQSQKPVSQKSQVIMVGDTDNMGYDWPDDVDKFSGQAIPADLPKTGSSDPQATDQVMVGTSYNGQSEVVDGYCGSSTRPQNNARPIQFKFNSPEKGFSGAKIGLYVVDFQAPSMGSHFSVTLDGKTASFIEQKLNSIDQTGPHGQFLTFDMPLEFLDLLKDGLLEVMIDDTQTGIGDGYAIDFARLILEPNK
jgi:flagellum-specific peptidoglycan hydrolase FlgJ